MSESPKESPGRILADYNIGAIERLQLRIAALEQQLAATQEGLLVERRLARGDYDEVERQLTAERERVDQITGALHRAEQRELEALAEVARLRAALGQCQTFIDDWIRNYADERYARRVQAMIDAALAADPGQATERVSRKSEHHIEDRRPHPHGYWRGAWEG